MAATGSGIKQDTRSRHRAARRERSGCCRDAGRAQVQKLHLQKQALGKLLGMLLGMPEQLSGNRALCTLLFLEAHRIHIIVAGTSFAGTQQLSSLTHSSRPIFTTVTHNNKSEPASLCCPE
jgi:hypothetical protein